VGIIAAPLRVDDLNRVVEHDHGLQSYVSLEEDPTLDPVRERVLVLIPDKGLGRYVENIVEFLQSETKTKSAGLGQSGTLDSRLSFWNEVENHDKA
jgi:hypothetical protein